MGVNSINLVNQNNAVQSCMDSINKKMLESKDKSAGTTEKSDNAELSDDYSKMTEIAKKYDVTNISANELGQLADDMFNSGLISGHERLMMKMPMLNVHLTEELHSQGYNSATISGFKFPADPDKKFNLVDFYNTEIENAQKYGNDNTVKNAQEMLEITDKLQYFAG